MEFINLTPHDIIMNNGTTFCSKGVARVNDEFTEFDKDGICSVKHGKIKNLPAPKKGVAFIVSAMVLTAAKEIGRLDVVAPATGHPLCKRENGFITSVPGFVR